MFDTPRTVILIRPDGLQFINHKGSVDLPLGEDVIYCQELLDKTKLALTVSHFITQEGVKNQEAVLLLANSLVYSKAIDIQDLNLTQKSYDKFMEGIPFTAGKISKLKIYEKDRLIAVATNKELYQSVIDIFKQVKWQIKAVIPKDAYKLLENNITPDQVDKIFNEADSLKKFNFLNETAEINVVTPQETLKVEEGDEQKGKNAPYLYITLALIVLFLIFLGFFFKDRIFPKSKPQNLPQQTVMQTIEASVSAIPQLTRQDIAVQILNASGRAGEASKIKDLLSKLGYTDISTSNYSKITNNTLVQFGAEIPENIKQEIIGELNKSIASVSAETTSSATRNIGIIIGK